MKKEKKNSFESKRIKYFVLVAGNSRPVNQKKKKKMIVFLLLK